MSDREALEARANALRVKFAPNIGDEKLAERVKAAETEKAATNAILQGTTTGPGASGDGAQTTGSDASGAAGETTTHTPPPADKGTGETTPPPGKGKKAKKGAESESTGMVRITCAVAGGRRRGGRRWPGGATEVPAADLSAATRKALEADPMFQVSDLD